MSAYQQLKFYRTQSMMFACSMRFLATVDKTVCTPSLW